MVRKLPKGEKVGAAAVLACKGDGPLSAGGILSGALSNPIPGARAGSAGVSVRVPRRRAAA